MDAFSLCAAFISFITLLSTHINQDMGRLIFLLRFVSTGILVLCFSSWMFCHSSRATKLPVHIIGGLLMLDGYLMITLLDESYSLSLALAIFLIITVLFVGVLGYEANKVDNEINDVRDHEKEPNNSLALSATLTILLYFTLGRDVLFGGLLNQTASDKRIHSIYVATSCICYLSYIFGVINLLLNSHPPKVHCKAHQEKVRDALGFLNFLFILLVVVSVVATTALHLNEYALVEILPQLAALAAWLQTEFSLSEDPISTSSSENCTSTIHKLSAPSSTKEVVTVAALLAVLAAYMCDSSTHSDCFILFYSTAVTSYLSKQLLTRKETSTPGSEQAMNILTNSTLICTLLAASTVSGNFTVGFHSSRTIHEFIKLK